MEHSVRKGSIKLKEHRAMSLQIFELVVVEEAMIRRDGCQEST